MRNFNKWLFFSVTFAAVILLVPSFLAVAAEDEGMLPYDDPWMIFVSVFNVLRFPTHTLMWSIISNGSWQEFFGSLIFNCMFYGLLVERIFTKVRSVLAKQ